MTDTHTQPDEQPSATKSFTQTWRKRPVEVQVIQYTGDNWHTCLKVGNGDIKLSGIQVNGFAILHIHTLEGVMSVQVGDYIIKGVEDEFYPCKPNIFLETYEQVSDLVATNSDANTSSSNPPSSPQEQTE